ncbi:hypothetical protein [Paracidovorax avenae]|uniref:hypothetical protein n=1 Tax=Paracidovorax avenae TaxID=80867 RepID=UPI000AA7E994|nr:hypothetical protein [Paracidovorax avenae]
MTHIVPGSENFVLDIPLHGPTCRVIEEHVPVIHYTRDMIASASPGGHRHVLQVNAQGNRFFLCNEGKSANFMHGGVVGPFIDLVQAELLFALSRIGDAPRDMVVGLGDGAAGGGSVSHIALTPAALRPGARHVRLPPGGQGSAVFRGGMAALAVPQHEEVEAFHLLARPGRLAQEFQAG